MPPGACMLSRLLLAILLSAPLLTAQGVTMPQTPADAEKLEAQLETKPDDVLTRSMLLRFYSQANSIPAQRAMPLRRKHILWLIEHRPEEWALSDSGMLDIGGTPLSDPEAYAAADALWRKQFSGSKPPLADVYVNAVNFYKIPDRPFARKLAEEGLAAYPANARLAEAKGALLGFTILGVTQVDRYGYATVFDDSIPK